MGFCRHRWDVKSQHYWPPRPDVAELSIATEELQRELLFGLTVIVLECRKCRMLREERFHGQIPSGQEHE